MCLLTVENTQLMILFLKQALVSNFTIDIETHSKKVPVKIKKKISEKEILKQIKEMKGSQMW